LLPKFVLEGAAIDDELRKRGTSGRAGIRTDRVVSAIGKRPC